MILKLTILANCITNLVYKFTSLAWDHKSESAPVELSGSMTTWAAILFYYLPNLRDADDWSQVPAFFSLEKSWDDSLWGSLVLRASCVQKEPSMLSSQQLWTLDRAAGHQLSSRESIQGSSRHNYARTQDLSIIPTTSLCSSSSNVVLVATWNDRCG